MHQGNEHLGCVAAMPTPLACVLCQTCCALKGRVLTYRPAADVLTSDKVAQDGHQFCKRHCIVHHIIEVLLLLCQVLCCIDCCVQRCLILRPGISTSAL